MRLPDGVRRYLLHLLERDAAERALDTAELEALAAAAEGRSVRPLPELLRGWVSSATAQMRWKRARPVAAKELADQLSDQYEAFLDEGMNEDAAAQATAREMGDAVETGTQLDRAWRPRPDWVMLGIVLVVAAAGLVLQYWLRLPLCESIGYSVQRGLRFQLFYFAAGVCLLLAAYFADYTILGRRCWLLYGAWIGIGLLLTQGPIAMGKNYHLSCWVWFFPVLFAGILFRQRGKGTRGVGVCLLSLSGMWFFATLAPSMAALGVLTVVSCGMLFMAVWHGVFGRRTRGRLVLAASPVLTMALYCLFLIVSDGHIREALWVVLHPQSDAMGNGYQGAVAQNIMFGIPFPFDSSIHSVEALLWRNGATDWVFIAAKYYWGWAAVLLILAAAVLLLVWGFRIARKQTGLLARSVCMGVMVTFALQTIMYVLQNCGIILIASYGLPLLSYGGTYLCQTMLLLGLLLSAQRSGQLESGLAPLSARSVR